MSRTNGSWVFPSLSAVPSTGLICAAVLVPARTGLFFWTTMRGHDQNPNVIWCHPTSLAVGVGRRTVCAGSFREGSRASISACASPSVLYTFLKLILLLLLLIFLPHCCFQEIVLSLWFFTFCAFNSQLHSRSRKKRESKRVAVWFERVKGEVLFINQDSCFNNLHMKYMRLCSMTGFAPSFDFARDLPIRICSNIMKSAVGEMQSSIDP